MNQELLKEITQGQIKAEKAAFKVGDGVRVHTKVREGDKERIQIFAGIVIARKRNTRNVYSSPHILRRRRRARISGELAECRKS